MAYTPVLEAGSARIEGSSPSFNTMTIYTLEISWGEYADHEEMMVGVFSSEEKAKAAKEEIKLKADRNKYPWCYMDGADFSFLLGKFELDDVLWD
jgi:hypothetical protein